MPIWERDTETYPRSSSGCGGTLLTGQYSPSEHNFRATVSGLSRVSLISRSMLLVAALCRGSVTSRVLERLVSRLRAYVCLQDITLLQPADFLNWQLSLSLSTRPSPCPFSRRGERARTKTARNRRSKCAPHSPARLPARPVHHLTHSLPARRPRLSHTATARTPPTPVEQAAFLMLAALLVELRDPAWATPHLALLLHTAVVVFGDAAPNPVCPGLPVRDTVRCQLPFPLSWHIFREPSETFCICTPMHRTARQSLSSVTAARTPVWWPFFIGLPPINSFTLARALSFRRPRRLPRSSGASSPRSASAALRRLRAAPPRKLSACLSTVFPFSSSSSQSKLLPPAALHRFSNTSGMIPGKHAGGITLYSMLPPAPLTRLHHGPLHAPRGGMCWRKRSS